LTISASGCALYKTAKTAFFIKTVSYRGLEPMHPVHRHPLLRNFNIKHWSAFAPESEEELKLLGHDKVLLNNSKVRVKYHLTSNPSKLLETPSLLERKTVSNNYSDYDKEFTWIPANTCKARMESLINSAGQTEYDMQLFYLRNPLYTVRRNNKGEYLQHWWRSISEATPEELLQLTTQPVFFSIRVATPPKERMRLSYIQKLYGHDPLIDVWVEERYSHMPMYKIKETLHKIWNNIQSEPKPFDPSIELEEFRSLIEFAEEKRDESCWVDKTIIINQLESSKKDCSLNDINTLYSIMSLFQYSTMLLIIGSLLALLIYVIRDLLKQERFKK
jgi:hypothetical protein